MYLFYPYRPHIWEVVFDARRNFCLPKSNNLIYWYRTKLPHLFYFLTIPNAYTKRSIYQIAWKLEWKVYEIDTVVSRVFSVHQQMSWVVLSTGVTWWDECAAKTKASRCMGDTGVGLHATYRAAKQRALHAVDLLRGTLTDPCFPIAKSTFSKDGFN